MLILSFICLLIAISLTIFAYMPIVALYRRVILSISVLFMSMGGFSSIFDTLTLWSVAYLTAMAYLIVNAMRFAMARMNEKHLIKVTRLTYIWLWVVATIMFCIVALEPEFNTLLVLYLISALVVSSVIVVNTVDRLSETKTIQTKPYADAQLPTVTIAIAARNETETLRSCLNAVLKSDYPKLEILVLDDCSQDKTAQVIREYAHQGVRFVQGEPPLDETWLPKNKAYQQLLEESAGQIVIYMGVDVRLKADTVRQLIQYMLHSKKDMVSVLPKRTHGGLVAAFIQPMRYWWELAVPRLRSRPNVLSTLWAADRKKLLAIGGFEASKRAIVPEWQLAKHFSEMNSYQFLRHDKLLPVTTHKNFVSQWLTAVRTRYPQVKKRPEFVMAQGTFMVLFLLGPYAVFIFSLVTGLSGAYVVIAFLSVVNLSFSHTVINALTNPAAAWLSPFNFPFAVIVDLIALHISMWRYEFGEVEWKGRNVCEPVMHVYPSLPPVEEPSKH